MLKLSTALSALFSGAWIAGYAAIVGPVILKWIHPGGQNESFIFWACAGWVLYGLIALCNLTAAYQCLRQKRRFSFICLSLLIAAICVGQALGYHDTYAVRDTNALRDKVHPESIEAQKQEAIFHAAHKASEQHIGWLFIALCANMVLVLTLNCREQATPTVEKTA